MAEKKAKKAREDFERKFSSRAYQKGDEVSVVLSLPAPLLDALLHAFGGKLSKSRIRALIRQGAVRRIGGGAPETLSDESVRIADGDLIKAGKLNLFRFKKK